MERSSGDQLADFPVPNENWEMQARSKRLREAVKRAGGNLTVAGRSGIPVGTLNNYIAGRDMKAGAMIALAKACEVSLEWLATGQAGPDSPHQPVPAPPAALFATLDFSRFASCLDAVLNGFAAHNLRPDTRRALQLAALMYDAMGDDKTDLQAVLQGLLAAQQKR